MSQAAGAGGAVKSFKEDFLKLIRVPRVSGDGSKRRLSLTLLEDDSELEAKSPRIESDRHKLATMGGEISVLKHKLQQESIAKRNSIHLFEEEINSLNIQKQKCERDAEEYKSKSMLYLSSMNVLQDRLNECKQQLTDAQNGADDKLFKLARANIDRENELMEKMDSLEAQLGVTKGELLKEKLARAESDENCVALRREIETKSKEVEEYQSYLKEKEESLREMSNLQMKIQSLKDEMSRNKEADALVKAMKTKLDKYPRMEKENTQLMEDNKKLREREANIYLLQDENRTLRRKVDQIAQTQADLASAESEAEKLRSQLNAWEQCGSESDCNSVFRSPDELHRHLRELQRDNLQLSECRGRLQSSVSELESRLRDQKWELTRLQRRQQDSEERSQTLEAEMKRVNQRFKLVSQERDFVKRLVDEYEHDTTTSFGQDEKARLAYMDMLLSNYKSQIAEQDVTIQELRKIDNSKSSYLSTDKSSILDRKTGDSSIISQNCEKLIADLRQRIAEHEEKISKLTQENDILQAKLEKCNLQGDYDPTTTKILHLEMNPEAQATTKRAEELNRLKTENEKLQRRIRKLEEARSTDETLEMSKFQDDQPSIERLQTEVKELKSNLESESRKADRLIEVFKEKSRQMREACFHLLGHKMDIKPSGEVKLTSSLADGPDDFLLFKAEEVPSKDSETASTSGGRRWMMMETEYSLKLRKDIEHYIQTYGSIPALVCSVFLENFGRQTMLE